MRWQFLAARGVGWQGEGAGGVALRGVLRDAFARLGDWKAPPDSFILERWASGEFLTLQNPLCSEMQPFFEHQGVFLTL